MLAVSFVGSFARKELAHGIRHATALATELIMKCHPIHLLYVNSDTELTIYLNNDYIQINI